MIKNFIYLDEYKMYSLSSQIFEGVTEYLVNSSYDEEAEENSQKGPISSGRILGDIMKRGNVSEEKKFLHDYSYSIFETHLIKDSKVIDINCTDTEMLLTEVQQYPFVKIKGKVIFNDMGHLAKVLKDSNKLGVTLDRIKSRSEAKANKKSVPRIDEKHLKDLLYILDFGFGNQLEIQMKYGEYLFSSNIKREYLREEEGLLIKKYARKTEKEFTIFGIVTQLEGNVDADDNFDTKNSVKQIFMNMVSKTANVEQAFTGKLANEIMIDPIAIYTEL